MSYKSLTINIINWINRCACFWWCQDSSLDPKGSWGLHKSQSSSVFWSVLWPAILPYGKIKVECNYFSKAKRSWKELCFITKIMFIFPFKHYGKYIDLKVCNALLLIFIYYGFISFNTWKLKLFGEKRSELPFFEHHFTWHIFEILLFQIYYFNFSMLLFHHLVILWDGLEQSWFSFEKKSYGVKIFFKRSLSWVPPFNFQDSHGLPNRARVNQYLHGYLTFFFE